jgi:hypothetical protein
MTLECPECGEVRESKNWQDCANKHADVGMYQVIQWGKYWSGYLAIKNKGVPEEKKDKSLIVEEIGSDLTQGTQEMEFA